MKINFSRRAPKRAKQLSRLRPRSVFGSFGVVLMCCKVNFQVVLSALQNSVRSTQCIFLLVRSFRDPKFFGIFVCCRLQFKCLFKEYGWLHHLDGWWIFTVKNWARSFWLLTHYILSSSHRTSNTTARKQPCWKCRMMFYWTWTLSKLHLWCCFISALFLTPSIVTFQERLDKDIGMQGVKLDWFRSHPSNRCQQVLYWWILV